MTRVCSRLAAVVVSLVMAAPAGAQLMQARGNQASPCGDSLYVSLRMRALDSLSAREYTVFVERDKACALWQSSAKPSAETGRDNAGGASWYFTQRGAWRVGGSAGWTSTTADVSSSGFTSNSDGQTLSLQPAVDVFVAPGIALGLLLQRDRSSSDVKTTVEGQPPASGSDRTTTTSVGPRLTLFPLSLAKTDSRSGAFSSRLLEPYVAAFITTGSRKGDADGTFTDATGTQRWEFHWKRQTTTIGMGVGVILMMSQQVGLDVGIDYQRINADSKSWSGPAGTPPPTDPGSEVRSQQFSLRIGLAAFLKR